MKTLILTVFFAILFTPSIFGQSPEADSCEEDGRNHMVCFQMKHLRSHMLMLDTHREMLRVNYPHLNQIGLNIEQLISDLQISSAYHEHLEGIDALRNPARRLAKYAEEENPEALVVANSLKNHCQTCHSNQHPRTGHRLSDIYLEPWSQITKRCNEPGRNPYVCKHMNAMVKNLNYFKSAYKTDDRNFELTRSIAQETIILIDKLKKLSGPIHQGGNEPLEQIQDSMADIIRAARDQDERVFNITRNLTDNCNGCHNGIANFLK